MYEELSAQIKNTQARWIVFIEKLNARAKELYEAALPELTALRKTDTSPNKSAYNKILSGVCGQLESIRSKAYDTHESEIIDLYYCLKDEINMLHQLYEFRNICHRHFEELEKSLLDMKHRLRQTAEEDLESEYAQLIASFNADKKSFFCSQCGHPLPIDRIFFIAVHIACPACGAQNTLEPGSHARSLQGIAQELALKRAEHLLNASQDEKQYERDLYHKAHSLKLAAIHKNAKEKEIITKEIEALNIKRNEAVQNSHRFYREYLRAVRDEMNELLPEFKAHHDKVYLKHINQLDRGEDNE